MGAGAFTVPGGIASGAGAPLFGRWAGSPLLGCCKAPGGGAATGPPDRGLGVDPVGAAAGATLLESVGGGGAGVAAGVLLAIFFN